MQWTDLKAKLLSAGSARITGEPAERYIARSTAGPGAGAISGAAVKDVIDSAWALIAVLTRTAGAGKDGMVPLRPGTKEAPRRAVPSGAESDQTGRPWNPGRTSAGALCDWMVAPSAGAAGKSPEPARRRQSAIRNAGLRADNICAEFNMGAQGPIVAKGPASVR